ncbi:TonB family protein [Vitreoscilla sp. C1]|uniref:energy transducer TonB n=1 Tax=Vitreoscilla sp. (strain C1) TaxID=96942 RepID=UPI000CDC1B56|nr:energy transducer TonB [Vitreoscilla sp. C1]AUZ05955.1 TonB family protein [Vitreoscilla sp. C1]
MNIKYRILVTALALPLLWSPMAHSANNSDLSVVYTPKLFYPNAARLAKQEGLVVILGQVNAQGKVTQAHIKTSSGHADLDQAALKQVQKTRFKPLPQGQDSADFEQPIQFTL